MLSLKKLFKSEFVEVQAELIKRTYSLARPFGLRKASVVLLISISQGVFQVLGVTSIFPFLAVASDPGIIRDSGAGRRVLGYLPPLSDEQLLIAAGILAISTMLLSNIINLLSDVSRVLYAKSIEHSMRVGLLKKMALRPYGDFLLENSGILLKKVMADVSTFTNGVLLPLLDSFTRIVTIILLLSTLFILNPQVAAGASLVFGAFYLIVFRILGGRRKAIAAGVKIAYRGMVQNTQQFLGGIKPIKVHQAEKHFVDRFETHSASEAKLMVWMPVYSFGPRYLIEPLAFGGVVLVVLIYARSSEELLSMLPFFGIVAFAGYRLLPAVQALYGSATQLTTARHALDEVYEEFASIDRSMNEEQTNREDGFSCPPPYSWERDIVLEDVGFRYPGESGAVFEGFNFEIPKNSSVGIIGQTGSGKSTLVDLILGLHFPSTGSILIDGKPLTPNNRRSWQAGIGYVPQDIFLTDDTISANIAFGVPEDEVDVSRLREVASAAQLLNFIEDELPQSWNSLVGERGVRLSGGQRQRIGLARALYHRPSLLILDEATSALDVSTENEVLKAINALSGQVTILIIAHRLNTIQGCSLMIDLNSKTLGVAAVQVRR